MATYTNNEVAVPVAASWFDLTGVITSITFTEIIVTNSDTTLTVIAGFGFDGTTGVGGSITAGNVFQILRTDTTNTIIYETIDAGFIDISAPVDSLFTMLVSVLAGPDTINGSSRDDILRGYGGNDTINGGGGVDIARYTGQSNTGPISVILSATSTVAGPAGGNIGMDTLSNVEHIIATNQGDTFVADGTFSASLGTFNVFEGRGGNDTITGNGNTRISFDSSNASVTVSLVTNTATGADIGTDTIVSGVNSVLGSQSADSITGNGNANTLIGQGGNDTLIGGGGADIMEGGLGDDVYSIDATGDVVTEVSGAGSGSDTVFAEATFTLGVNIETLILVGTGAINGTGNAQANNLIGNGAANTLTGGDGGDGLTGAGGSDTLIGGLGNDGMAGGVGDDLYSVDSVFDVIAEVAGEGLDTVFSETNHVLYLNVKSLILVGTGNTQAYGNLQQNFLYGNAGNNYFDSAGQADYMHGGGGSDVYRMRLGELNGDLLGDFASGDLLQFQGYNAATTTVTQLNSFQYRVQDSASGANEVFGIVSNYTLTAADYTFV